MIHRLPVAYDWGRHGPRRDPAVHGVKLHDETLRDGLQSPSMRVPALAVRQDWVRRLDRAGVHSACLGLPGAGPHAVEQGIALVGQIVRERLALRPVLAGRTHHGDVDAILEVCGRTGVAVEATLFLGASPVRLWVEGWNPARLASWTERTVGRAVRAGLRVSFVTEDTSRAHPDLLGRLFDAALQAGATRLVLCDTTGHCTPRGATRLVRWTRAWLDGRGLPGVGLDWHGHDDRGLALPVALAAAEAGCDRVHGCLAGVGERVGNVRLEALARELTGRGTGAWDVEGLRRLAGEVSRRVGPHVPQEAAGRR